MKQLSYAVFKSIVLLAFFTSLLRAQGEPARDPIKEYPPSAVPGVIIVGPKTMNFLKRLGPDAVFYTSRAHPLRRLANITNSDTEFAAWGIPLLPMNDLMTLKYMIGGKPEHLRMIGNGNFSKLFYQNPQLRLFVTNRKISFVETIDRDGGGMKVMFELF